MIPPIMLMTSWVVSTFNASKRNRGNSKQDNNDYMGEDHGKSPSNVASFTVPSVPMKTAITDFP